MGVSPWIGLVFGIDDFHGDIPDEAWETHLYVPKEEIEKDPFEQGYLKDVFYNHATNEWGYIADHLYDGGEFNPGVIGMVINRSKPDFDNDIVRALSLFHPEYETSGKRDIPVWERVDHPMYARRLQESLDRGTVSCGDVEYQWSWFYPAVVEMQSLWAVHAYCTRWLLRQAGIEIDYRRYKAMLVWQWS